jgi:anti-sigma regulatory factor (Ser/Thr protein kinase)
MKTCRVEALPPLAALPTAPACARAFIRLTMSAWSLEELADSAELVTSELVTNAVEASSSLQQGPVPEVIRVACLLPENGRLLIEVWDQAPGIPALRDIAGLAESGRGLTLVNVMATNWGWRPANSYPGKCVWGSWTW